MAEENRGRYYSAEGETGDDLFWQPIQGCQYGRLEVRPNRTIEYSSDGGIYDRHARLTDVDRMEVFTFGLHFGHDRVETS